MRGECCAAAVAASGKAPARGGSVLLERGGSGCYGNYGLVAKRQVISVETADVWRLVVELVDACGVGMSPLLFC